MELRDERLGVCGGGSLPRGAGCPAAGVTARPFGLIESPTMPASSRSSIAGPVLPTTAQLWTIGEPRAGFGAISPHPLSARQRDVMLALTIVGAEGRHG